MSLLVGGACENTSQVGGACESSTRPLANDTHYLFPSHSDLVLNSRHYQDVVHITEYAASWSIFLFMCVLFGPIHPTSA